MSARFTDAEKAAEARREVALRRAVYARRVDNKQMGLVEAKRLISIMEEIAAEYSERAGQGKLDL